MGNSVTLHRVIKTTPEKIYRAFTNASALAKFNPQFGFTCTVHHFEPVVNGTYRMSFTNFTTGKEHAFGGLFLELIPNEKIVMTDLFEDTNLPGEMKTTIALRPVSCGTDLSIVQEGIHNWWNRIFGSRNHFYRNCNLAEPAKTSSVFLFPLIPRRNISPD